MEAVSGEAVVAYDRRAANFVAQLSSFVRRCVAVVVKMSMAELTVAKPSLAKPTMVKPS